jgi:hypothetical protein
MGDQGLELEKPIVVQDSEKSVSWLALWVASAEQKG